MGNQNRLKHLHKIHNGTCTKCLEPVGMFCVLQYEGYTQDSTGKRLIGPKGEMIKQATVEHINPRSNGGTNSWENLTLLCAECNHDNNQSYAEKQARISRRKMYLRWIILKRTPFIFWLCVSLISTLFLEKELAFVFSFLFLNQVIIFTKVNSRFL